MKKSKDVVIITRHQGLVELLREMGFVGEVIPHATENDVRGKVVIGILPLHLAAMAEKVIVPILKLSPEDRGKELDYKATKERFIGLKAYKVEEVD